MAINSIISAIKVPWKHLEHAHYPTNSYEPVNPGQTLSLTSHSYIMVTQKKGL